MDKQALQKRGRVLRCSALLIFLCACGVSVSAAEKTSSSPSISPQIAVPITTTTQTLPGTALPKAQIQKPSVQTAPVPGTTVPGATQPSAVKPSTTQPSTFQPEKVQPTTTLAPVRIRETQSPPLTHVPRPTEPERPPKLARVTPTGCYQPGQEITVSGSFLSSHANYVVAIDGQGGHFHLTVTAFNEATIKARLPTALPTAPALLGPYLLRMEPPGSHQGQGNILTDLWVCEAPAQVNNRPSDLRVVEPDRRDTPADETPTAQTPTVASPQREPSAQAPAQRPVDPAPTSPRPPSGGGTLIGATLPSPPQVAAAVADAADDDSIEAEQVVIITATMAEATTLAEALAEYGARVKTRQNMENLGMVLNVFRLPAGQSVNELLPVLRQRFTNLWIDTNQRFQLMNGDKKRHGQEAIGWDPARTRCLKPVSLGIIDTQVDVTHPALQDVPLITKSFLESGETPAKADHGTAVAALLVGRGAQTEYAGLLPNANIYAANVFRQRGKEKETTVEWLVLGLDWLLGQKVQLINLSLGGDRNLVLELTLRKILAQGTLVVAAAGNGGPGSPPVFPAAQEGVVAVTAIDAKQRLYRKANTGHYVDIAAPGVDIWVADERGKGRYQSGTSYATPLAAAALAARLVLGEGKPAALIEKLADYTIDLGPPGRDGEFGWGLIQWPDQC